MFFEPINIATEITNLLNTPAVAAFLGSFSAFIFGIFAYNYTKRRERYKQHHDAVVKSEQLINRHLNQISGNIFLLNGALGTYEKGAFSENVLSLIDDPDFLPDFYNLEIINKYNDYSSLVEKVNHDMNAWNLSNDRLFTAAFSGVVNINEINTARNNLSNRTKQLLEHLDDLMQETYTFGAYVRIFLRKDKRGRFANLKPTEEITVNQKEVKVERMKLVKESNKTMKKDREGRLKKYYV